MLWKCKKGLNFKFESQESPLLAVTLQTQELEVNINYMPPWIPQNRSKSWHFDRIIKQDIILVKTCLYKLNTRRLWRITNFFQFFWWMINFVKAVLCFGSHICNQAARISVNKKQLNWTQFQTKRIYSKTALVTTWAFDGSRKPGFRFPQNGDKQK